MPSADIVTPVFRLSFPQVFKPKAVKGSDKEKFGITMLFIDQTPFLPKDANGVLLCPKGLSPDQFEQFKKDYAEDKTLLIQIRRLLKAACDDAWGTDRTKWPAGIFRTLDFKSYVDNEGKKYPIQNGDHKEYEGYAGHLFARAGCNADRKPGVVDRHLQPITEPAAVYGGLLARANVNAYAWKHDLGGAGVSLGLNHLQIIANDGVRFGGGVSLAAAGFGEYEGPEDDPSTYSDAPGGSGGVSEGNPNDF